MYVDIYKGRVYAPDDYTILVDTLDARVSYAGIVAEKYNTIPHIIFFSNKPIPEFSESDEERIYELCATINSDVEKIHNNEVRQMYYIMMMEHVVCVLDVLANN